MYKSIILSIIMVLILSSCSFFQIHQQVIEQGNIIDPQITQQLHPGMSQAQVTALMGSPLLVNIFTPNRTDYVYTYSKGNNSMSEKRVTCTFVNGRLSTVNVG